MRKKALSSSSLRLVVYDGSAAEEADAHPPPREWLQPRAPSLLFLQPRAHSLELVLLRMRRLCAVSQRLADISPVPDVW